MPGVANWECSGVHHRVALEECISIWYFGSCLLFVCFLGALHPSPFLEPSGPRLFGTLYPRIFGSTPAWRFFRSLHRGFFLEHFTVWLFWSSPARGFLGALHRGAFWELSTPGLFGALHHFDFESPFRFGFFVWNSTTSGVFGVLHCTALLECFTATRPECLTAWPWRSASAFSFVGAVHHLVFWSSRPRGFFGAFHRLGFLEHCTLELFGSAPRLCFFGPLHPGAFSKRLTSWVF